jgi:hypothetical protein
MDYGLWKYFIHKPLSIIHHPLLLGDKKMKGKLKSVVTSLAAHTENTDAAGAKEGKRNSRSKKRVQSNALFLPLSSSLFPSKTGSSSFGTQAGHHGKTAFFTSSLFPLTFVICSLFFAIWLTTCENSLVPGEKTAGAVTQNTNNNNNNDGDENIWEPTRIIALRTTNDEPAVLSFMPITIPAEASALGAFDFGDSETVTYNYRLHFAGEIFSKGTVTISNGGTIFNFTSVGGKTFSAEIDGDNNFQFSGEVESDRVVEGAEGDEVNTLVFQETVILPHYEPLIPASSVSLTYNGVNVTSTPYILDVDSTAILTAVLEPANADTQVWYSTNMPDMIRIEQDGLSANITALKGGRGAIVKVRTIVGGRVTECNVTAKATSGLLELDNEGEVVIQITLDGAGSLLFEAITWLNGANSEDGKKYKILLNKTPENPDSQPVETTSTGYTLSKNITVMLEAVKTAAEAASQIPVEAAAGVIQKTGSAALFAVAPSGTSDPGPHLVLGSNITLKGNTNTGALVSVGTATSANKAKLTMLDGSKITNNTAAGGVLVSVSGTFIMEGGSIDNNKVTTSTGEGGGVYNKGIFTMSRGEIENNVVGTSESATNPKGGGVSSSGTFTMSGGSITDNECLDKNSANTNLSYGGGVYLSDGTFRMSGTAVIANNSAKRGGGVGIAGTNAKFYMEGGVIKGNVAKQGYSSSYPGIGAAVAVYSAGLFEKTGGTIYGLIGENANTGTDSSTCSMQKNSAANTVVFKRNTTAGSDVNLTSENNTLGNWE